jgi:hypothetical protein
MGTAQGWQEAVRIGFQVFADGSAEEFGAVREICPAGKQELVVNIENGGDHLIPLSAIVGVHDEKVIVDVRRLKPALQGVVARAHDAEVPGL